MIHFALATVPLPFTAASIARAIKGVEKAGRFVIGVKSDGTVIVGEKPIDPASLVPKQVEPSPDLPARHLGEYFNGGSSET